MHTTLRTTLVAAACGGFLGLVCTGVWAVDRAPEPTTPTAYVVYEGSYPPAVPTQHGLFTDLGYTYPALLREPRLPIPLWLAMPIATTGVGAVAGAMTARAGFRFTRETTV